MNDARIHFITESERQQMTGGALIALVRARGLVCVRKARLSVEEFRASLQSWGRRIDHPFLPVESQELGFSVLDRPADRPGAFIYGGAWHQNLMFMQHPPDVTVLYAETVSDQMNFTAFVDLVEPAQWYSEGALSFLKASRAIHSTSAPDSPQNRLPKGNLRPEAELESRTAVHGCYVGDSTLGVGWPFVMSNYIVQLEGWKPQESMPIVQALRDFATYDEFVIRHYWEPSDLLFWDNRRYMHRATITHQAGPRRMWRADLDAGWGLSDRPWETS